MSTSLPQTRSEWQRALDALPSTPSNIPAFFFGHGSPLLAWPEDSPPNSRMSPVLDYAGPGGLLSTFLRDFGPALIAKYRPKGILVFSAHWETDRERLVSDYGSENPLLMDYYGFAPAMYALEFHSGGASAFSQRVVEMFTQAGLRARLTTKEESRGQDGRGFEGPGLDHGVFVPFRLMFGETFYDVPIVEASMAASMSPHDNWAIGKAVAKLRQEGILVLSGGLTVHNLRDFSSFSPSLANPACLSFNDAVTAAMSTSDPAQRKAAMMELPEHAGFRQAHPREDHFVPVYVAAGAGEEGDVRMVSALYGCQTVAFGL